MNDHTEERRWREELAQDPPLCYDKWLERDRPWWMYLEEDKNWMKLQENAMLIQVHKVTGWDVKSQSFPKTDTHNEFELRTIIIKSGDGDVKIDMFLKDEDNAD